MATVEEIREALKNVYDPEIGFNVVDLGLVYKVEEKDGVVHLLMTLTTPACPLGPMIIEQARDVLVGRVSGVKDVSVEITYDPPWDPRTMASEEVRFALGLWQP